MKNYSMPMRKAAILVYLIIVLAGAAAGASVGYVYRRLPAMQVRYNTAQRELRASQTERAAQAAKLEQDPLEDFVYERFYKPVRGITRNWKSHVKDSLKAESNRVLEEQRHK